MDVLPPPVLETITSSNDTISLTWSAISGSTYRVQFETNLNNAIWLDLPPDVVATGPTATAADTMPTNAARFYRVRVVP